MNIKSLSIALVAAIGAMICAYAFFSQPDTTSQMQPTIAIVGSTPSAANAHMLGPKDPNQITTVAVGLKLRNDAQLDKLIAAQNDPSSPQYHKFLTSDEFTKQFGPTQADYDKVVAYLKGKGMTIVVTYPNRLIVVASGTNAQIKKTFGTVVNKVDINGSVEYINDSDPKIPAQLQNTVQSVTGLSSLSRWHSNIKHSIRPSQHADAPFGATPQQIASAYNYPNANNAAATTIYTGKGRTVAVATAFTYNDSDVQGFWQQFGIKRTGTVTRVPVGGTATDPNDETTLDLSNIGAQAPGADILMYMAADASNATFDMMFNQIVIDNKADIVSISWGDCESDAGASEIKTENAIFKQGTAQGISFFAASGDDGAYDCNGTGPKMSVDYPSSDPFVTAVGGTTLQLNKDGSRKSESAWSGGGGGVSANFPRPQWQTAAGFTDTNRDTADISLSADPEYGYAYFFQGAWNEAGGTSFAAPNWSALWALSQESTGERMGLANVAIYRIGSSHDHATVFTDITTGDNGNGNGPGYKATVGWDHPTGWGVPDGTELSYRLSRHN